jgi:hypothetical protein
VGGIVGKSQTIRNFKKSIINTTHGKVQIVKRGFNEDKEITSNPDYAPKRHGLL